MCIRGVVMPAAYIEMCSVGNMYTCNLAFRIHVVLNMILLSYITSSPVHQTLCVVQFGLFLSHFMITCI